VPGVSPTNTNSTQLFAETSAVPGQGLSIVRNAIVKGHGGELDFVSDIGKGTTFHVRLPINRPA